MRKHITVATLLTFCIGSIAISLYADDYTQMVKIVNLSAIKTNPYTRMIQCAFWPQPEVFAANQCDRRLIENDVQGLGSVMARVICDEYLPATNQMKTVVGIPEYLDGDDYLFLRYTTKRGVHVEVQRGWSLCVLMSCPDWEKSQFSEIGSFVRKIALLAIRYPKDRGIPFSPTVFVSSIDIGKSRCGSLCLKREGVNVDSTTDYYSDIWWWSDGVRVLFVISTLLPEDYARIATIVNCADQRTPHRFQHRTASVQSTKRTNVVVRAKESVSIEDVAKRHDCVLNLHLIHSLKSIWAREKGKTNGAPVGASVIDAYYKARMPPVCPAGGIYTYNPVGVDPVCSYTTTNSNGMFVRHRLRDPN